ncbi:MAG: OmpA family protein [bacterium]
MRILDAGFRCFLAALALCLGLLVPQMSVAQADPFATGWLVAPEESRINFQSVKLTPKGDTVLEFSSFAKFVGAIGEDGAATVKIFLDSVDTKVDLRNVRMRFLFLETFKFPEAVVSVQLDRAALADLPQKRRMTMILPYKLDLHGFVKEGTADVSVSLLSTDEVAIATIAPIPVVVADYGLSEGITKLEEASGAKIVPTGWISFDLLFRRIGSTGAVVQAEPTTKTVDEPTSNLSAEGCIGRMEILSRSGNINFNSGSARLDVAGSALLDNLYDIVNRCPTLTIEVGGHTDSDGNDVTNQVLSEQRAGSVISYLVGRGIPASRFVLRGYGQTKPIVPNDSAENKRRNRRIEFTVVGN